MKLRNLLLTAALFLTGSIASAAVVYDQVSDGGYVSYDIPYESAYYLHESKNPGEEGFLGDTYGKLNVFLSSNKNPDVKYSIVGEFNKDIWAYDLEEGNNTVYLPTYLDGQNGSINKLMVAVKMGTSVISAPLFQNSSTDAYGPSATMFTPEGRNTIAFNDGNGNIATVTFGNPLPTPVITLLIALGFGAAFVMYRNRKQVKA